MSTQFASVALSAGVLGLLAATPAGAGTPTPALKTGAAYATARSFEAPDTGWPADRWWRDYGDPQLDALIEEALAGSPDMAAAKARLDEANALAGQARSALYPTLSGAGSVADTKESYHNGFPEQFVPKGYQGTADLTLNFNYEIDFWGKNRAAVAAAVSEARAAAADAAQARLVLSTAVASAYADLARLWAERDVAARAAEARRETFDLVNRRVSNGLDTRGDLSQAQAGPPAARADLAAIDESIVLTQHQLAALLGEGPDRGLAIARPAATNLHPAGLPPTLSAELIGRRPDLTAARWRALEAAKRIHVAQAAFYPNVNLAAYIGYQSLGLSNLFISGSSVGQAGPAVSLPIFDGGQRRANLRGARADYAEAVASYEKTLAQALQETADATASERALTERLKESSDALAANEEAYRIARLRYDGGLSNYQAVLLAEDAVLSSRRTVADLNARAFTLDVQLVRALGGGFSQTEN